LFTPAFLAAMTWSVFDSAVTMMKGVLASSGSWRTSLSSSQPVIGSMFQSEMISE
jgi:hypothetical protein